MLTMTASPVPLPLTQLIAVEFVEQAQVTNWPARLGLVALMLAIIAATLWAMRRGWQARMRRQADLGEPAEATGEPTPDAVPGLYIGTAFTGDWLDRVAAHGLGVRSRANLDFSTEGIAIYRSGAPSLWIPAADILAVRVDRGVAGTVRSKDSVLVVTWRLGDRDLDTGFRADEAAGHRTLLDGLMSTFPREARA